MHLISNVDCHPYYKGYIFFLLEQYFDTDLLYMGNDGFRSELCKVDIQLLLVALLVSFPCEAYHCKCYNFDPSNTVVSLRPNTPEMVSQDSFNNNIDSVSWRLAVLDAGSTVFFQDVFDFHDPFRKRPGVCICFGYADTLI